jgi:hypothetical protein
MMSSLRHRSTLVLLVSLAIFGVPRFSRADCAAVQAAMDAVPASGGVVTIPTGTTTCTQRLTISNKTISIVGNGPQLSILTWAPGATSTGIAYSGSDIIQHRFTIRDLSVNTSIANAGTAISASFAAVPSNSWPTVVISHVEILGTGVVGSEGYWTTGLYLKEAWHAVVTNVFIRGRSNTNVMSKGMFLDGFSVAATIRGCQIYFANTGINVGGTSEGVQIDDTNIVAVLYGIFISTTSIRPGSAITDNHINAGQIAIYANNRAQLDIKGNLIYGTGSASGFVGIYIAGSSSDIRIRGNAILGTTALEVSTGNGIVVNGPLVTVTDNQIAAVNTAVWFQPLAALCRAGGNTFHNGGAGLVVFDQPGVNRVEGTNYKF